ncbi:MAG: cyclic nucleotide-binding domain-containing protein [Spirochaetaceae bacterium]|nr:cyclic nucleotide-binding domain-containing protein [Spirochaetaceae bacterium]
MMIKPVNQDTLVEELRHTLILQNLGLRELKRFAAICETQDYAAGEFIVQEGSIGSDLHILIEGEVEITVKGKEREEVAVSSVRKGDVFGEAAIFMDVPRTANAKARTRCMVVAASRERVFKFCDENPRAGLKIFGFVIYSLLRRLSSTSRELALQREAVVTAEDIERLSTYFPKSLEEMLKD